MSKIRQALALTTIFLCGVVTARLYDKKARIVQPVQKGEKYVLYYNLLNQWVMLKNSNIGLEQKFIERDIKKIAIYGMGEIGNRLYEELKNSEIEVIYGIDNSPNKNNTDISIVSLNESLEDVDAIVVTAVFDYDNIYNNIKNYCNLRVISLEDIVFDNL